LYFVFLTPYFIFVPYFRRMHLLEVLNVGYAVNDRTLLHTAAFALERGDRLAIAGSTGSGKTTLLKLIAGLLQPSYGKVMLNGEKVLGPLEKLLPGHAAIAYLSQHFELRNNYYVHELLEMASKVSEKEAATIYHICEIDHLLQRRTNQLSGGERQRIVLASLLTIRPAVLLLDEPFSNADMQHRVLLKTVLDKINRQLGTAMILVAHDPADVLPWAEQVIILQDGKVIQQGTPHQVYYHPVNEYAAGLMGHYNLVPPSIAKAWGLSDGKGTALLMVRPEQLYLQKEKGILPGIITQVDFMGGYQLLTVKLADYQVQVATTNRQWVTGDAVYVNATAIA